MLKPAVAGGRGIKAALPLMDLAAHPPKIRFARRARPTVALGPMPRCMARAAPRWVPTPRKPAANPTHAITPGRWTPSFPVFHFQHLCFNPIRPPILSSQASQWLSAQQVPGNLPARSRFTFYTAPSSADFQFHVGDPDALTPTLHFSDSCGLPGEG